ncbi:MAG: DUF4340 domain-containing protein [Phycisphaerales bacterium]
MSNRTLLIALAVVLTLAGLTALVIRSQSVAAARAVAVGERLLDLSVGEVAGLSISGLGAAEQRIERDAEPGSWRLVSGTGSAQRRWPLDAARVQDVLRLLCEVRATGTPSSGAAFEGDALTLNIEHGTSAKTGGPTLLRLSGRRMAGSVLAEVRAPAPSTSGPGTNAAPRTALVADGLLNVFTSPGPREWRDRAIMPWAPEAVRVRLIGGGTSVALAKTSGKWSLSEPIQSPADTGALLKTLGALQQVSVAAFMDDALPAAATLGFDAPLARVILERDPPTFGAPGAGAAARTDRHELIIGQPADAKGTSLYATLDGGTTAFTVSAERLAQIATDPARYVSPTVSQAQGADIGVLLFHPAGKDGAKTDSAATLGVRRTLDGWVELRPDGTQVTQDPARASVINNMIAFLTSMPSKSASLDEPTGFQPLGSLKIMDASGGTMDEVVVARSVAPGIVMLSGRVYRGFVSMPEFLQIALGPVAPLPSASAEATEINK